MANVAIVFISICFLIVLSYIVSQISFKTNISSVLLGLIAGLLFNGATKIAPAFQIPNDYFSTLALMAFVVLIFDATAQLKLRTADTTAWNSLAFITLFAIILFVCFSIFSAYYLGLSVLSSVTLAAAILGTSAISKIKISKYIKDLLDLEEYWTTPVALLAPLIIAIFAPQTPLIFVSDIVNFFFLTFIKVLISIGCGIFIGIILMKVLLHEKIVWMPSTIIASVFITFGLGYYAGGYGVFAVASLGFFFANAFATVNTTFLVFHNNLTKYAGVLSAVMLGIISRVPFSLKFFGASILLYLLYLLLRFAAIHISHKKDVFSIKEELVLTLHSQNSAAVCALLLFITLFPPISIPLGELYTIITTGLIFLLCSNLLSFALTKFPKLLEES